MGWDVWNIQPAFCEGIRLTEFGAKIPSEATYKYTLRVAFYSYSNMKQTEQLYLVRLMGQKQGHDQAYPIDRNSEIATCHTEEKYVNVPCHTAELTGEVKLSKGEILHVEVNSEVTHLVLREDDLPTSTFWYMQEV